ncbi:MAG: hypothetical protein LBU55_00960 [Elusimicrobiota bacterium]|jgi:hypothetical protein|nr:hypothetical protein [Elusimicrobiota bacterium]
MKSKFVKKIISIVFVSFLLNYCFMHDLLAYSGGQYHDYDENAQSASPVRILYGAFLLIGGIFLTYDGFRLVKKELHPNNSVKDHVSFEFSSLWYERNPSYVLNAYGTITNTSRYTLTDVVIYAAFLFEDEFGNKRQEPSFGSPIEDEEQGFILKPGEKRNFTHEFIVNRMTTADKPYGEQGIPQSNKEEPTLFQIVNITGNMPSETKYEEKMNNVYEGLGGVILIGIGIYILVDYFANIKKYGYWLKKNNMEFYVTNAADEFKLHISKKV